MRATAEYAESIVFATAGRYPLLVAQGTNLAAMEELLRRMIWSLQQAGIQSGRQQNPSGAISKDKLTIFVDGAFHAFDVLSDSKVTDDDAAPSLDVHFHEVTPVHYVADTGIADGQLPTPIPPPPPPPPARIPYDESKAIEFGLACNDIYRQTGAAFDPGMISVHSQRCAWDYYVGCLSWEVSKRKHVNDFRVEYGLPPL